MPTTTPSYIGPCKALDGFYNGAESRDYSASNVLDPCSKSRKTVPPKFQQPFLWMLPW